jgi:hypothetical protein
MEEGRNTASCEIEAQEGYVPFYSDLAVTPSIARHYTSLRSSSLSTRATYKDLFMLSDISASTQATSPSTLPTPLDERLAPIMRFIFLSILAPAVVSTTLSDNMIRDLSTAQTEALEQRSRLENRDTSITYSAWATDPKNENELLETRKFLNDTVVDQNRLITFYKAHDGSTFVWGGLTLDAGALEKVKAYPKIEKVKIQVKKKYHRAISREEEKETPT